ncbi:MAG: FAD-binding oxidoreductase [Woeseiaceae bacterium]|nr:FAD-binding oxidoreductase [Woeseiaceae bacterium]
MESPVHPGDITPMPKSLWAATTARPEPYPLLQGRVDADVCIVGGGIMGLSTALALAERGTSVALLEAAEIGWGASGRNNGLVAPGLKRDPWQVRRMLGAERGARLLQFSGAAPDRVFELIDQHGIDCDADRRGWIQAAHSKRALKLVGRRFAEWEQLGVDASMLDSTIIAEELGSDFYKGGCLYGGGGSINPLAYTHGLAQAAATAGALLHEQSPAVRIERQDDLWIVVSPYGAVVARHLLFCTNAYNESIERLQGTVIPLRTAQVATRPLPQQIVTQILPGAASASDTQRLLTSFRLTADRRLIMGGASATAGDAHPDLVRRLHAAASERFAGIEPASWEFGWSGYLALTRDHLPYVSRIDKNCMAPVGCNGRGIAMSTAMGRTLADLVGGMPDEESDIPVGAPRRIVGFGLRRVGVAVGVVGNRLLDRMGRLL